MQERTYEKILHLIILDDCFVTRGKGRGDPCHFPFVDSNSGIKYDTCKIIMDHGTGHNEAICASKVDSRLNAIETGICSRGCRTESKILNVHGIL